MADEFNELFALLSVDDCNEAADMDTIGSTTTTQDVDTLLAQLRDVMSGWQKDALCHEEWTDWQAIMQSASEQCAFTEEQAKQFMTLMLMFADAFCKLRDDDVTQMYDTCVTHCLLAITNVCESSVTRRGDLMSHHELERLLQIVAELHHVNPSTYTLPILYLFKGLAKNINIDLMARTLSTYNHVIIYMLLWTATQAHVLNDKRALDGLRLLALTLRRCGTRFDDESVMFHNTLLLHLTMVLANLDYGISLTNPSWTLNVLLLIIYALCACEGQPLNTTALRQSATVLERYMSHFEDHEEFGILSYNLSRVLAQLGHYHTS